MDPVTRPILRHAGYEVRSGAGSSICAVGHRAGQAALEDQQRVVGRVVGAAVTAPRTNSVRQP